MSIVFSKKVVAKMFHFFSIFEKDTRNLAKFVADNILFFFFFLRKIVEI